MPLKPAFLASSLALASLALGACDWMKKKDPPAQKTEAEIAAANREYLRRACASNATYDRLKELAFDEAARIRRSDPRPLDLLAANSVVRMENPLVRSRDDALNVTVCRGRFVLELPPGAEAAFNGHRSVAANIEYAAQSAADGSGLVYQMVGAEPIIYRLAAFGLQGQPLPLPRPAIVPQPSGVPGAEPQIAMAERLAAPPAAEPPRTRAAPKQLPAPPRPAAPAPAPAEPKAAARPSFNCGYARTRAEKMVCASPSLAAQDRAMSSLYYSAIADADPATKRRIRATRDAFLARRERCTSESCIAAVYRDRIAEIRQLAGGG